ncbi:MAG: DUF6616 family protein [Pirellula sp.]
MYIYVEMWKKKASWDLLSTEERTSLFKEVDPRSAFEKGAVLLGTTFTQAEGAANQVSFSTKYDYLAFWNLPNDEVLEFLKSLPGQLSWWYKHFEQENIYWRVDDDTVLQSMLGIKKMPPSLTQQLQEQADKMDRLINAVGRLAESVSTSSYCSPPSTIKISGTPIK